jgi:mono/diheme cytochrome c family protein
LPRHARWLHIAPIAFGIVLGTTIRLPAEGQSPQPPRLILNSIAGEDSYLFYCASCHGKTGKGDGPVAASLKTAPPDLTSLASRNNRTFPRERVAAVIADGKPAIAAHGPRDMPVWGFVFRGLDPSEIRVRLRLENLVAFVESLQDGAGGTADLGTRLFRTYCASCHGVNALGDGPIAKQLLQGAPELTRFALRNGGVFPTDRVYDIIDGRGVRAHGDTEMPIWGDAFRSGPSGFDEATVKKRIEAIVNYLRAIQRRNA